MTGNTTSTPTIQTDLIPDIVKESIGTAIYKRFMEAIRDPDAKRRYDELGRAFMERIRQQEPT